MRLRVTLSDSNCQDSAIIEHLFQFRSGTGMHERSFEIKRLLHSAILNEKHQSATEYSGRRAEHRTPEIAQATKAISNGPTTKGVDQSRADRNAIGMMESLEIRID